MVVIKYEMPIVRESECLSSQLILIGSPASPWPAEKKLALLWGLSWHSRYSRLRRNQHFEASEAAWTGTPIKSDRPAPDSVHSFW